MDRKKTENDIVWHKPTIERHEREKRNNHKAAVIWFTGLSGSGKSTLAHALEKELYSLGCQTYVFDGDNVRHGLCSDLGFSEQDRSENLRRIGEMCKLFFDAGVIAITAFISPYQRDREFIRNLIGPEHFLEIFNDCSLDKCIERDVKGLYKKAIAGEIKNYTGISAPYESPANADLILKTDQDSIDECVKKIIGYLKQKQIIPA
ncbi:MAG: adenylyl-sulfate kinase [Thioalkalispiraceae bacterium]|jgi:adenylylsulfate kinase